MEISEPKFRVGEPVCYILPKAYEFFYNMNRGRISKRYYEDCNGWMYEIEGTNIPAIKECNMWRDKELKNIDPFKSLQEINTYIILKYKDAITLFLKSVEEDTKLIVEHA